MKIPKIIHQIWSGIDEPLPEHFQLLGETWKNNHPAWEYVLWDNARINGFIQDYYPHYWIVYQNFKYNIQRWDAIRYLILDRIGGLYADFDTECLKPIEPLIERAECCFSVEPDEHAIPHGLPLLINNAIMMSTPNHPFMKKIINKVFENTTNVVYGHRNLEILCTTGPLMLTELYENLSEKEDVYLLPSKHISPFTRQDTLDYLNNNNSDELENKLEEAYAVHYFFNTWSSGNK